MLLILGSRGKLWLCAHIRPIRRALCTGRGWIALQDHSSDLLEKASMALKAPLSGAFPGPRPLQCRHPIQGMQSELAHRRQSRD